MYATAGVAPRGQANTERISSKTSRSDATIPSLDFSSFSKIWDSAKQYRNSDGYYYRQILDPSSRKYKTKFEHILIWERVHGKQVPLNCRIHHRDLIRGNNNAENLMCVPVVLHLELHARLNKMQKTLGTLEFAVQRQLLTQQYEKRVVELMKIWELIYSLNPE